MRLQQTDLITYCNSLKRKTDWQFEIIPIKSDYWYWSLYIKDVEKNEVDLSPLCSWYTLREAHEYLRGFYRGFDFFIRFLQHNQ